MLLVAEVMMNVHRIRLVLMLNAKVHAKRLLFVTEMKSVVYTIIDQNAVAHQELLPNEMEHADNMMQCVEMMVIVHRKQHVLIANVLIHVMQHNHAALMLNAKYSIQFQFVQWFAFVLKVIKAMQLFNVISVSVLFFIRKIY